MNVNIFFGLVSAVAIGVLIGNNPQKVIEMFNRSLIWIYPKIFWLISIFGLLLLSIYMGVKNAGDFFSMLGGLILSFVALCIIWIIFTMLDSLKQSTFIKLMLSILIISLLLIWIFIVPLTR